jgi:SAM-dependent methyltransferase
MPLVPDEELEQSAVVANCAMNRERELAGGNGYDREIGFHPLAYLSGLGRRPDSTAGDQPALWLDLCCGTGKALIAAAQTVGQEDWEAPPEIIGVDLVGYFLPMPQPIQGLTLVADSLSRWQPHRQAQLVTCVHGLHYVGDKLGLLQRVASWLTPHGKFVANLDMSNLKLAGYATNRRVTAELRRVGFTYDRHARLLCLQGQRQISLPFEYLGADDQAGPNYTGQPAVDSHYREKV